MPATYILRCGDGSYYVGSTWNLVARLEQHQAGLGGDYTAKRQPVELIWFVEFDRIEDAYKLEKRVQWWSRRKREALMRGEFDMLPELSSRKRAREVRGFETRPAQPGAPQPSARPGFETRPAQPGAPQPSARLGFETRPAQPDAPQPAELLLSSAGSSG